MFSKGYTPNSSDDIFIIHQLLPRVPPVYKIKSLENEIDDNIYYKEQLIKVDFSEFPYDIFQLEKENQNDNYILKKINNERENQTTINNKENIVKFLK